MALTAEALLVFRNQHGMSTFGMLADIGMSRRSIRSLIDDELLTVLYERVLHLQSSPLTLEARCAALCLAYPAGYITGPTGGQLTHLRRMPPDRRVQFGIRHGSHIGPFDDVVLRQTTKLLTSHTRRRGDGIRIASAERLAFDLAADLPLMDHQSVLSQMLRDRKVSKGGLIRIGHELVHPGRRGSQKFMRSLLSIDPDRPVESHPELVILDGLRRRGVPVVSQVDDLVLPSGRRIRIDLAVPDVCWAIEVDVHPDHLLLQGTTSDKQRDRECHRIGWQVERVTELDLVDVEGICDELAENYRARCLAWRRTG